MCSVIPACIHFSSISVSQPGIRSHCAVCHQGFPKVIKRSHFKPAAAVQVFYGILVQHFANQAAANPLRMDAIDVLTVHILELTAEVPYYAATVARTRLARAHQRLTAANSSMEGSAWPGTPLQACSSWHASCLSAFRLQSNTQYYQCSAAALYTRCCVK